MRLPTAEGLAFIAGWEGWSATPYPDIAGVWTIGHGSTHGLDGLPVTAEHRTITEAEGMALLRRDVRHAAGAVERLCPVPLEQHQFDALVSWTYNLGSGALQASTMRRCILRGDHAAAADELRRWVWAGGQRVYGLMRRREAERTTYLWGSTYLAAA